MFIQFETGDPSSPDFIALRSDRVLRMDEYDENSTTIVYESHPGHSETVFVNKSLPDCIEVLNEALSASSAAL